MNQHKANKNPITDLPDIEIDLTDRPEFSKQSINYYMNLKKCVSPHH